MAIQLNVLNPKPPHTHTEEQHDYEDLEKYSEIRDIRPKTPSGPAAQSSLPAASGGDYEFTTCPAYVPVSSEGRTSVPSVVDGKGTEEGQYEVVVVKSGVKK